MCTFHNESENFLLFHTRTLLFINNFVILGKIIISSIICFLEFLLQHDENKAYQI